MTRMSSRRTRALQILMSLLIAAGWSAQVDAANSCTGTGIELQVLGSGGPELQDKRASTSYLIWRDGKARVLIDSGGGSALRFGEAGAQMTDLDVILFSHLHVDHTADFPALIKSSYFEERKRVLPVYGPVGNASFPSTTACVAGLFDPNHGIYRYLGAFVSGKDGGYVLQAHDVRLKPHEVRQVFDGDGLKVSASTVIHGDVPALAWRVDLDGRSIAFSGDTNGNNGNLQTLARGVDLFVAHNAVPEGVSGPPRELHMPPSVIGAVAHAAGVKQLVLSHRMLRSLGHEKETGEIIAKNYDGKVSFADDLDCFQ